MNDARSLPAPDLPSAIDALLAISGDMRRLRAAVAFVTGSGVVLVRRLVERTPELRVELTARGAPITDPLALEQLAELGVIVSVVIGRAAQGFHPKLWFADHDDGVSVLSGSGNLTAGGMVDNVEQFELLRIPAADHAGIAAQERRFAQLTRDATPLDTARATNYWRRWKLQAAERARIARETERLNRELMTSAQADEELDLLRSDLYALYERTKQEVTLTTRDGREQPYSANYFKRALDNCDATGGPLSLAARIVKSPTDGFERLAEAHRPELLVEALVLDESKPYHHRFPAETIAHARRGMARYDELFRPPAE